MKPGNSTRSCGCLGFGLLIKRRRPEEARIPVKDDPHEASIEAAEATQAALEHEGTVGHLMSVYGYHYENNLEPAHSASTSALFHANADDSRGAIDYHEQAADAHYRAAATCERRGDERGQALHEEAHRQHLAALRAHAQG
jgi:hypothetical protein